MAAAAKAMTFPGADDYSYPVKSCTPLRAASTLSAATKTSKGTVSAGTGGLGTQWTCEEEELLNPLTAAAYVELAVPAALDISAVAELSYAFGYEDPPELEVTATQDDKQKTTNITSWLALLLPGPSYAATRLALQDDILRCCSIYEEARKAIPPLEGESSEHQGCGKYRVKLELFDGPGCPRFHIDYVRLRLLRCYFGPTTETVNGADVDWEAFLNGGKNHQSIPNPRAIEYMPAGHVALLKGRKFHPGDPKSGCVHRSPDLDAPGWVHNSRGEPRRMFLRIDDMGC